MGNSRLNVILNGRRSLRPPSEMPAILVFATNPAVLRYASEILKAVFQLEVHAFSSLGALQDETVNAQAVILGPEFLESAGEVRQRFPQSFILGITDWCNEVPKEFHRWGDQIRDLATPFGELLDSWKPEVQEEKSEG